MPSPFAVGSVEERQEADEQHDRDRAADFHDALGDRRVAAFARIIMKTVQDEAIERRADLALGGLDQAETQGLRLEIDAVEIANDGAVRRSERDGRGVRV